MVDLSKIAKKLKATLADDIEDSPDMTSTGNLAFDLIIDGGMPFGHVVELLGLSASGKSTIVQKIIATAQKKYGAVSVLIDRENAFFKPRAKELGVDTKNLILVKPKDTPGVSSAYAFVIDTVTTIRAQDKEIAIAAAKNEKAKEAIRKTDKYKRTHIVIAIDSVAAFESDVDLGKSDSGRKAQQHHAGLRKILSVIDEQMMCVVTNHVTWKIGIVFGDKKSTTAGESYKYYGTVRCSLEEKRIIVAPEMNNEPIGTWVRVEVIKTRLGPCYRSCVMPLFYKDPIPYYGGIARLLVDRNIMKPTNADEFKKFKSHTVTYKGEKVNEFEMEAFLAKHPEIDLSKYPEYNVEKGGKKELTNKEE